MSPELRLLAWKSWRDVKVRLAWGLLALAALLSLAFVARSAILTGVPEGVWADLAAEMGTRGVRADELPAYVRFWWHEGGVGGGLAILAALLGAAGPGLDAGRGGRLLLASLPVRPTLPVVVHGAVVATAVGVASVWMALLVAGAAAVTGAAYPATDAVGMVATGLVGSLPAAAIGVLAAALLPGRVSAALAALLGLWAVSTAAPLLGSWSPSPAPVLERWTPGSALPPASAVVVLIFSFACVRASRARA